MKRIIQYESEDGVIFEKENDCKDYEEFMLKTQELLGERNFDKIDWKNFSFSEVIKNPKKKWEEFKKIAYEFSLRFCPEFKNHETLLKFKTPENFPGRMFSGKYEYPAWPCIYVTWLRFCAIDFDSGIEYLIKENKNGQI